MSGNGQVSRRVAVVSFAIASALIAVRLFVPATALMFSQRAVTEFNATGLPSWIRPALAVPEMLGAVLFVVPLTFYLGAFVLLLDLVGAIIVHLSLGIQPISLYVLFAAVLALALLRRHYLKCKPRK